MGDAKKKMTKQGERTYNYYRCGKNSPHRKCDAPKGYVNEEVIESQVLTMLESIQLTPELVTKTMEYLETAAQFDATENVSRLAELVGEHKQILNRKENLLDLFTDKKIDEPTWAQKRARLDAQLLDLEAHIKRLEETEPASYMALARRTLELTNASKSLYISMPDSKRRELLASLHSNLTLDHKKLMPAWRKPYASFAKLASCSNWLPESDAHQTRIPIIYEFSFGILNVRKGQKHIMLEDEYSAARQARVKPPKLPAVRTWLELAMRWQKRLRDDADLTRTDLAKEAGISPTRLTQILILLDLSPEIRRRVLMMEASATRSPVTERQLRSIARSEDYGLQLTAFEQLCRKKRREGASVSEERI